MSEFWFYLQMGFNHILDVNGLDHLLFIVSMCVFFTLNEWRKLLILVTAFTVGHSITLALSGLEIVPVNTYWIELLIPITIILTCINNLIKVYLKRVPNYAVLYAMVLIFGFVHGLGFSNFFKQMLFEDDNLILTLLSFNIGIEIGQLIIVGVFIFLMTLLLRGFKKLKHNQLIVIVSVLILLLASNILIEKI